MVFSQRVGSFVSRQRYGGTVGGFITVPTSLDLWATALGLTEGAIVNSWHDLSPLEEDALTFGSGADAVYEVAGVGGRPAIHLPAVTRGFSHSNPCPGTAMTWMIAYRTPAGAGVGANWSGNAALIWADVAGVGLNDYALSLRLDGRFTGGVGCTNPIPSDGTALTTNGDFGNDQPHLVTFRRNLGDWIIRVDGTEEAVFSDAQYTCPMDGPPFMLFGANGFAVATTWHLGRITAWPVALSDAQMEAEENARLLYYGI